MKSLKLVVASLVLMSAGLSFAGSTTGAGNYRKSCPALGTTVIHEAYVGGQLAVLTLVGDGDTDLDIYVYDDLGNLIVRGTGPSDIEAVTFVPRFTGTFRIVIVNLGRVHNNFVLRTN